jgi:hypothetical protein
MTCSQCQAALPSNAGFCPRCGTPAAGLPATALRSSDPAAPPPPATPPPPQNAPGWAAQPPAATPPPPPQNAPGWAAPGMAAPAASPSPAGAGASPFRLDLRRLTAPDRTIGIASVLLCISLFLPWYGVSVDGISFSQSGISGHGYLVIVLILALVILGYLVLRAGWDRLPMRLPVAHAPLLLVATGLQLLIVLIAFLVKPGGLGWDFGAFLGLIAAIAACAPIGIPAVRSLREGQR